MAIATCMIDLIGPKLNSLISLRKGWSVRTDRVLTWHIGVGPVNIQNIIDFRIGIEHTSTKECIIL